MIWRALPASACLGFCLRLDRKKTGRDFLLLPSPAAVSTFFVCSRAACAVEQAPWSASSERGLNNLSFSAYQEAFEARASGLQVRGALPGSRGLFPPGHSSRWAANKTRLVLAAPDAACSAFRIVAESVGAQLLHREPTGALCGGAESKRDSTSDAPADRLPMTRPTFRRSIRI